MNAGSYGDRMAGGSSSMGRWCRRAVRLEPDRPKRRRLPTSVSTLKSALWLAAVVFCSTIGSAAAQGAETARLIQAIMAGADYQRELPHDAAADQQTDPEVLQEAPTPQPDRSVEDLSFLRGLGGVAQAVLWTLVIAAVVLVVVHIARGVQRRSRTAGGRSPAAEERREAAPSVGLAGDGRDPSGGPDLNADRLASQGDIVEAIHLLLLMSLDHLRQRLGASLQPSLTSRELLDRLGLSEAQRASLGALVQAVELGHFGGRRLAPNDYHACRDHYARLVGATDGAVS